MARSATYLCHSAALALLASLLPGAGADASDRALPAVPVEIVRAQPVHLWQRVSGRLEAVEKVDIQPQVRGQIVGVLFEGGSRVERGEPLFTIDPRPYEAELAGAEAALAAAESDARLAQMELERAEDLSTRQAASRSQLDAARNRARRSEAAIEAARARLLRARLDLEYTRITAPVGGHISRARVTRGNQVEPGPGAPVLASIVVTDSLYVSFDLDERTYLEILRHAPEEIPVKVHTADGGTHYRATLQAFDNHLDTSSGTVRAWTRIRNDGLLAPGMYVSVEVGLASAEAHPLVEQRAIGTDQNRKYVYVISPENRVTYREVALGRQVDNRQVVLSGLKDGDRVMIDGLLRVRPNMEVRPVEQQPETLAEQGKTPGTGDLH